MKGAAIVFVWMEGGIPHVGINVQEFWCRRFGQQLQRCELLSQAVAAPFDFCLCSLKVQLIWLHHTCGSS